MRPCAVNRSPFTNSASRCSPFRSSTRPRSSKRYQYTAIMYRSNIASVTRSSLPRSALSHVHALINRRSAIPLLCTTQFRTWLSSRSVRFTFLSTEPPRRTGPRMDSNRPIPNFSGAATDCFSVSARNSACSSGDALLNSISEPFS